MRKTLILLVAFALIGVAVFADAPATGGKFTSWNQGDVYLAESVGGGNATYGWGPGWDSPVGVDQEWSFGWDGKNIGFSATMEFGGGNLLAQAPSALWFGTYYKFADLVKVTLGAPRISYRQYDYIEGGTVNNRLVSGEYAVAAEVTPLAGLTVGLAALIPNNTASIAKTFSGAAWQVISSATGMDYLNSFAAGVNYNMDKVGTFMAQYKTTSSTSKAIDIGATINAIQNIGVSFSCDFGVGSTPISIATLTSVQAAFAPLTLAATFGFNYSSASAIAVEAKAEYAIGDYAVGLLGGYDDGKGVILFEQQCGTWDGVEVYPYVKANFEGGYIQLGFVYASGANGHSSFIGIPLQYSWSF